MFSSLQRMFATGDLLHEVVVVELVEVLLEGPFSAAAAPPSEGED